MSPQPRCTGTAAGRGFGFGFCKVERMGRVVAWGASRGGREETRGGGRKSSLQTPRDAKAMQGMKETPSTRLQPSPPAETCTSTTWHSAAGHGDEPRPWGCAPGHPREQLGTKPPAPSTSRPSQHHPRSRAAGVF